MATAQDYDEFKTHPVWEAIRSLITSLKTAGGHSDIDRQTIARALAVMTYMSQFGDMSPYLFMSNRVAAASSLLNLVNQTQSYLDAWDRADVMTNNTVANIESLLDQVLAITQVNSWPGLQRAQWAKGVREAADAFRVTAEQSLDVLQAEITEAREVLDTLRKDVATLTLDSAARDNEAAAAVVSINDLKDAEANEFETRLVGALRDVEAQAAEQRMQIEARSNSALTQLDEDADRGKKLLSYIGDQSVGGGYDTFADKEKNAYRLWMGLGIIAVFATLGYLAYEFTQISDLTPATAILKGTLSLTALGFSTFAFREAGKRSRQAVEAKYRALDLLALRPYTDEMDEAQTAKLRFILGERLFGPHSATTPGSTPDDGRVTLDLDDATKLMALFKTARDIAG